MKSSEPESKIFGDLSDFASKNKVIRRLVKSSSKPFRAKSPNDVQRLVYLATLLYVDGDQKMAESIFEFIDLHTETHSDGRRDLAVELSFARLIWAFLLRGRSANESRMTLLGSQDISASYNLSNVEPQDLQFLISRSNNPKFKNHAVGVSLVDDILLDTEMSFTAEEECSENTPNDMLRSSFLFFLDLVVIRERSEEIRDKISTIDDLRLDEGIELYKQKMKKYLALAG